MLRDEFSVAYLKTFLFMMVEDGHLGDHGVIYVEIFTKDVLIRRKLWTGFFSLTCH